MRIEGLQKLTLLDYPGRMACTVFLGGCNFRCPFCHNSDLLPVGKVPAAVQEAELMEFLHKRQGILDGVCVTGGEPLLNADIGTLLEKIKALGYAVKLDTNGSRPEALKALVGAGVVDAVAMDIKNSPARYAETVGMRAFDLTPVRESVAYLLTGAVPFEFRTTVVREFHGEDSFTEIGRWIKGAPRYFLQGFVDSERVLEGGLHPCTKEEMERFAAIVRPFVGQAELRGV